MELETCEGPTRFSKQENPSEPWEQELRMPFDGTDFAASDAVRKIDRVIELLETEERWCKGLLKSADGRRCILGALQDAKAGRTLEASVLRAIRDITGQRYFRIPVFNDDPRTSHALVMTVLRSARHRIVAGEVAVPSGDSAGRRWWRHALARMLTGFPVSDAEPADSGS